MVEFRTPLNPLDWYLSGAPVGEEGGNAMTRSLIPAVLVLLILLPAAVQAYAPERVQAESGVVGELKKGRQALRRLEGRS